MTDFAAHWNSILKGDEKNQVDIVASIHEDGINHFLTRHFEIDQTLPQDNRKYYRVFERTFETFGDERKFKLTLSLTEALRLKLPPFTKAMHLADDFEDTTKWNSFDFLTNGPELIATNNDNKSLVEIIAPGVSVSVEWPNLDTTKPPHNWTIPPFQVFGQAELQLNQEGSDFFVTIIPKLIKIDIPRNQILKDTILNSIQNSPTSIQPLLEDCEEKFVDLFIIAANIAAYEQTPKLITSIKLPVPIIQERPIQPAAFDISRNIMTVGCGIDKVSLENFNEDNITMKTFELEYVIKRDIQKSGGLQNIVFKNAKGKNIKSPTQLITRSKEEQESYFKYTNEFIKEQHDFLQSIKEGLKESSDEHNELQGLDEAFAIGINEYFFDAIVSSVIPKPKSRCENEVSLGLVKGYICHWSSFRNPDVSISPNAVFAGSVDINVGGSIHACVKKFWDCSWRWACAKLALAIVGRPTLKIQILKADGIRTLAQLDAGDLHLATNLPFPFNEIVKFFSSVIIKFIIAFSNILAVLLTFYILKPEFKVEQLSLKLNLKNFSSFFFERTNSPSQDATKNKFICFKTSIVILKLE